MTLNHVSFSVEIGLDALLRQDSVRQRRRLSSREALAIPYGTVTQRIIKIIHIQVCDRLNSSYIIKRLLNTTFKNQFVSHLN